MTTKKQNEMLQTAIMLINAGEFGRAWEGLWEDNENNTNALFMGLLDYMEGRPEFCKKIKANEDVMPPKLERYAQLYMGEKNPLVKKFIDEYESFSTDLESLLNQIDDINRFNYDIKEKWDYLNKYYIGPLSESFNKVNDAWCEVDI